MAIAGISDQRRLQIIGKIRTGKKVPTQSGKMRPFETSHFVLDPLVRNRSGEPTGEQNPHILKLIEKFGPEPKELPIILPLGDRMEDGDYLVARQGLKWYAKDKNGVSKVLCSGNNAWADYRGNTPVEGVGAKGVSYPAGYNRVCNMESCPQFKSKNCNPNMKFIFWIQDYPISAGFFSIDTSSLTSMIGINSTLEMAERTYLYELLKSGVISSPEQFPGLGGVPLKLFRKEVPNRKGGVNYPFQIEVDIDKLNLGIQRLSAGSGGMILPMSRKEMVLLLDTPEAKDFDDNIIDPDGTATVIDEKTGEIIGTTAQVAKQAEKDDLEDWLKTNPSVNALFVELCTLRKTQDSIKIRKLTAQKFVDAPDQRMALIDYLTKLVKSEKEQAIVTEAKTVAVEEESSSQIKSENGATNSAIDASDLV